VRVAFQSGGGPVFAAGLSDRAVYLIDGAAGTKRPLGRHDDLIMSLIFSPDGQFLASSSHDQTVRIWPLGDGHARILRGHNASVNDIAFSPDGARLVSSSQDGTIRLWSIRDSVIATPQALRTEIHAASSAVLEDNARGPRTPR